VPFRAQKDIKDEVGQSEKAAKVFTEIMDTPDKGIPQNLFDSASCVAVFPAVLKAAFIVGGQGGRGVASCRAGSGWTSPAYLNMGGGSVGFQIGAEATDFVLLIMNQDGMRSLLSDKFTLGGDASVAAGPVGREAGASSAIHISRAEKSRPARTARPMPTPIMRRSRTLAIFDSIRGGKNE
jgi:lipid-binding SYLF domain-containing protein